MTSSASVFVSSLFSFVFRISFFFFCFFSTFFLFLFVFVRESRGGKGRVQIAPGTMFNVLPTVWAVLALLVVLALGMLARATKLLKPQDIAPLNKFIFMFCIPCLAFKIMGLQMPAHPTLT